MRAAEVGFPEDFVRIGNEVAVGEEQEFDQVDDRVFARRGNPL